MGKIHLTKRFNFSSAHRMFNGDMSPEENQEKFGKCQNVHGHNYYLEITISGIPDKNTGYFINLSEFSTNIKDTIIQNLDHQYLNDVLPNCKDKPVTMEIISTWIWQTLNSKFPEYDLFKIRLWETLDNSVEIYK